MDTHKGAPRGEGDVGKSINKEENHKIEKHIFLQGLAACSVGLDGLVASVAMGYTSPALPSMRADQGIHITPDQESWVGAVMPLAALAGSIMGGPLVDRFGRRATLLHLSWPFCLSWVVIAMAGDVNGLLLGRVMGGVCVGVQAVTGSVFVPEMVHVSLRNVLAGFPAFGGTIGFLVSFGAGQALSWRGLAWVGAGLCLLPVPLLLHLPETPHYLTRTGQAKASLKALLLLRGSVKEAEEEQEEINRSVSSTSSKQEVSLMELVTPPNAWPVGVGVSLMIFQQTSGINAVLFFASTILEVGGEALAAKGSVLLGVMNVVGTFVGLYCITSFKRRESLRRSMCGITTNLLVLTAFFWCREAGGTLQALANRFYFIPVVALLGYMLSFSLGFGPIPWVFLGEGMPSKVRGKAAGVVVAVNWGFAFIITKTFGWSLASLGSAMTFLSYALVTSAGITLLLPIMPETFKKSTAEMDKLYRETAAKKRQ